MTTEQHGTTQNQGFWFLLPPGTFSPEQLRTRKILFRLSAVVVGVLAAVIIGFFLLLMTAVAFM